MPSVVVDRHTNGSKKELGESGADRYKALKAMEKMSNTALYLFFVAASTFYVLNLDSTNSFLVSASFPLTALPNGVDNFVVGEGTKVAFFMFQYLFVAHFWLSFLLSLYIWYRMSTGKSYGLMLLNLTYFSGILARIISGLILIGASMSYKTCNGFNDTACADNDALVPLTNDQYVGLHIFLFVVMIYLLFIVFPVYMLYNNKMLGLGSLIVFR